MSKLQVIPSASLVSAPPEAKLDRNLRSGMMLAGALVFGLGGLAATIPITGAVVAGGEVSVESQIKRLGHPSGGVISSLFVKDGSPVKKGQLLMQLDATVSGANAAISSESVEQLLAREARLTAERDASSQLQFPPQLAGAPATSRAGLLMREEQRVFSLRREAVTSQDRELTQRVAQLNAETEGYRAQISALREQTVFIQQELVAARELWKKGYTTLQRVSQIERSAIELKGNIATAQTQIAQTRAKIAEVRQQSVALWQNFRTQASTDLSDVQAKLGEMRQRSIAASDTNQRNDIRSPVDGTIDKLAYTTIGGVVPPNVTIMEVVPKGDRLIVTARVSPSDIDQVTAGQPVRLRLSAFNAQTTPEIDGAVDTVSADRISDERTGISFYKVLVTIEPGENAKLGNLKLKPGMPAEVFIQTGSRTMLNYIMKPLRDQFERAFRHD
ncbi:MAG: HlyD family type I secretion periplasmic adaptor subunit [Pseudomonadota bacterium]